MLDEPRFLLFLYEVPEMVLIILLVIVAGKRMQQIIVEITCACALQAGGELLFRVLFVLGHTCVQFRSKSEGIPRISLNQRFFDRLLGAASVIDVSGVKISAARFDEQIHHFGSLFNVDAAILKFRKTHQSETELKGVFSQIIRHVALL